MLYLLCSELFAVMDSGQNSMVPTQIKLEVPVQLPPPPVPVVIPNNTGNPMPGGSGNANNGGPGAQQPGQPGAATQPQKKFPCHLCRRSFMHKQSLDIHMRSHTGKISAKHTCGTV